MSTYLGLHYHIIFATKDRRPFIKPDQQPRLHEYLGGIVGSLDGKCRIAGGVEDHVHLLVSLKATHRLSNFMRELKKAPPSGLLKPSGTIGSFMPDVCNIQNTLTDCDISELGIWLRHKYLAEERVNHCLNTDLTLIKTIKPSLKEIDVKTQAAI